MIEIIAPVAEILVSGLMLLALILSAMFFAVMMVPIIRNLLG